VLNMDKKEKIKEDMIDLLSSYVVDMEETFRKMSEERGFIELSKKFGVKRAEKIMNLLISMLDDFEKECEKQGE